MKASVLIIALICSACAAEFDTVKFPHRNLQTGEMEQKYIYWPPEHEMPPIVIPERFQH